MLPDDYLMRQDPICCLPYFALRYYRDALYDNSFLEQALNVYYFARALLSTMTRIDSPLDKTMILTPACCSTDKARWARKQW
ncbi:hypothetical protein ETR_22726 [Erwinia tracheiphila PSU-1]|nr:hypothetical protein ETR_22726 [Erwinia tracheiphila PSU-1]